VSAPRAHDRQLGDPGLRGSGVPSGRAEADCIGGGRGGLPGGSGIEFAGPQVAKTKVPKKKFADLHDSLKAGAFEIKSSVARAD